LSSRSSSVLKTGTTAMAFACGRAGMSQSYAQSDGWPMTTVPSGDPRAGDDMAIANGASQPIRALLHIEFMVVVL
jgi:hypothetical protein